MTTTASTTNARPNEDEPVLPIGPEWVALSALSVKAQVLYEHLCAHDREQIPIRHDALAALLRTSKRDLADLLRELEEFGAIADPVRLRPRYEPPPGYTGPLSLEDFYQLHGWGEI